jgi:hypothetical protein
MHGFIEHLKTYLLRKFCGDFVAWMLIGVIWVLIPGTLVWAFDANATWIGEIWNQVYPHIGLELQLASDAVSKAHEAVIATLNLANGLLGEDSTVASRLEAGARILLIGEVWVVKIQFSSILRMAYRYLWG